MTVIQCMDIQQALRHKMSLDAAGIPSFIPDEFTATTMPYTFFGLHGVRLQVPAEFVHEAREVLKNFSLPPEKEPD